MSLGSWDPKVEQAKSNFMVDIEILKRFIAYADDNQLDNLQDLLSAEELQTFSSYMQLDQEIWLSASQSLIDNEIESLIRFFTVAENLPGWDSGEKSPVIGLGKSLKKRGVGINRDLVLWIKANSDNQYLPHGPLL